MKRVARNANCSFQRLAALIENASYYFVLRCLIADAGTGLCCGEYSHWFRWSSIDTYISFRNKASWWKDTISFRYILSYFPVCIIIHKILQFKKPCSIGIVDWLWYDKTDVSELRPHGTIAHPRLIAMWTMVWWYRLLTRLSERSGSHQYCLAVLSAETSLERVGEWAKEMRI
jgi:hypothetical protein